MKNILIFLGSSLLKKLISTESISAEAPALPIQHVTRLNVTYIRSLALRWAAHGASAFIFSLFFVAGTMMALYSMAQSFENSGTIMTDAIFYTGFFLSLISLVIALFNISTLRHLTLDTEMLTTDEQVLLAPAPKDAGPAPYLLPLVELATILLAGIASTWASRQSRIRNATLKDSTEIRRPRVA